MVNSMLFLQSFGYYGGGIGDILSNLQQLGFFDYLLPFLIIFSIVYGILSKAQIFGQNKSINAIISLSIGLMALQFGIVSSFFSEIFPRLGIGLSIILVILVLTGLFRSSDDSHWQNYILLATGLIIGVVILIQSAGSFGFDSGSWWYYNWPTMIIILIVGVLIALVIGSSSGKSKEKKITIGGYN